MSALRLVCIDCGADFDTDDPTARLCPRHEWELRAFEEGVCRCGCGASLADMRADARYYSRACIVRYKRNKREPKVKRSRRKRRLTKNGKGSRIYLLEPQFGQLLKLLERRDEAIWREDPETVALVEKLRAGRDRCR